MYMYTHITYRTLYETATANWSSLYIFSLRFEKPKTYTFPRTCIHVHVSMTCFHPYMYGFLTQPCVFRHTCTCKCIHCMNEILGYLTATNLWQGCRV